MSGEFPAGSKEKLEWYLKDVKFSLNKNGNREVVSLKMNGRNV